MHPHRRRKKRPNYGIRTVEVERGPNGFGFTISGQQPCILSCIVANSPADQAGLRAGDFLISVNGLSVSKITHDAVVKLIGNSFGPIKMSIAEYYYSDSSDEELDSSRVVNNRKPKYVHKPRTHREIAKVKDMSPKKSVKVGEYNKKSVVMFDENDASTSNNSNAVQITDKDSNIANQIEYKALVGYLGTIEMPKQLLPSSRLQIVCSCIRKLRQEKRTPSAVLMTVLPSCLSLKNSNNQILAIFPASRVVYISSSSDKESRYFGLVTSAICENYMWQKTQEIEISNSCHVFVTDPKLTDHNIHIKKAQNFNITCTSDIITGNCLEFPKNALYVVSLVQNMYQLQPKIQINDENMGPIMANSPHPSASSNSDSGIGFRDDCGNISDRILVVEFPAQRQVPVAPSLQQSHRPSALDGSNDLAFELSGDSTTYSVNNVRAKVSKKSEVVSQGNEVKKIERVEQKNRVGVLNNVRACDGKNEQPRNEHADAFKPKDHTTKKPPTIWNRLTVRAMPDPVIPHSNTPLSDEQHQQHRTADIDTGQIFSERAIDVPHSNAAASATGEQHNLNTVTSNDEVVSLKSSVDNISVHSARSFDLSTVKTVFKSGRDRDREGKKKKLNSCENLAGGGDMLVNYKLSPKVYGVEWAPPIRSPVTVSCEELSTLEPLELDSSSNGAPGAPGAGFGSLQDLCSWAPPQPEGPRTTCAVSEPDVRFQRRHQHRGDMCEDSTPEQNGTSGGAACWAASFEKLLEDPLGVQIFAEFLKKEFSAENIYFWTACERFRRLGGGGAEAARIHRRHLCPGAPEPVNVDSHARQYTQQQLQDAEPKLFEQAQKQIFNLMKFDSYPRFLKSSLYNQCLSGTISMPALEPGLLFAPGGAVTTPSKLKKSLSNAEDRRRKSLLPWHRKNRSKSKDRGETEYQQRQDTEGAGGEGGQQRAQGKNGGNSSQSSLTSLDLAMSCSIQQESLSRGGSQDDMSSSGKPTPALCRVILSDGSTTVVQIRTTETVRQLANRLLNKRGLNYSAIEVHGYNQTKAIDLNDLSSTLSGCEVVIEQRVVFKLDLPNRKVISVKSKTSKLLLDVLRPILHKYGYTLDQVHVTTTACSSNTDVVQPPVAVDVTQSVMAVDGRRLNVQLVDESKNSTVAPSCSKPPTTGPSLDEITNRVFEQLLHEKAETSAANGNANTYDRGSVKSEDWGSEHSSGIFGRFLRRDSAMHERKKKLAQHVMRGNVKTSSSVEDVTSSAHSAGEQHVSKKPLIAKWKAGAKLQVATSESDELYEGLKRAQRCRLEDQRGTEINFELPDFLKDKENAQTNHKFRKIQQHGETARFYDNEMTIVNKQITEKFSSVANTRNLKDEERYTPAKFEKSNSCPNTPSKGFSSLENSLVENDTTLVNVDDLSPKAVLPPPLPPKPKVLPIKPSNWGQNNFLKQAKPAERSKQTLFLEQPTSSFV